MTAIVVVVAAAVAVPVAVMHARSSPHPKDDSTALALELAALANRSTQGSWLVTFAFTRITNAGGRLHDTVVSANYVAPSSSGHSIAIDRGLGSLVVTTAGRTYSCTDVGSTPECISHVADDTTSKPGAVYGGAVVSGRYSIARAPDATIAGIAGRCFSLRRLHGNPIPGLGFSSEQCYSSAGVPLRSRVQNSGAVDERMALVVRRTVGRSDLTPLLVDYGLSRLAPPS